MAYRKNGALIERLNPTVTSGGTLTLANNSPTYQQLTGTTTHTVTLPQANGTTPNDCPLSLEFVIMNRSTGIVTVNYFGGTLAKSLAAGTQATFHLTDASTSTGSWDITNEASSGGSGGSSVALSSLEKLGALAGLSSATYSDAEVNTATISTNVDELGGNYWLIKNAISAIKAYHSGFVLSGYGFINGGYDATNTLATTERYSDDSDYWLIRQPSTFVKFDAAMFDLNGGGYTVGGRIPTIASTEKYDPSANAWSTKTAITTATYKLTGFTLNGLGYAGTGFDGSSTIATLQGYSDTNNAWYSRQPVPAARNASASVALNGYGYLFGGTDGSSAVSTVYKYDASLNSWVTSLASMLSVKSAISAANMNGVIVAAGGNNGSSVVSDVQQFSDIGVWTTRTSLSAAKAGACTNMLGLNGVGVSSGGDPSSTYLKVTEAYYSATFYTLPITFKSTSSPNNLYVAAAINKVLTALPARVRTDGMAWKYLTANSDSALKLNETLVGKFVERGQLYAMGGDNNSSVLSTNQRYSEVSNIWVNRTSMPAANSNSAGFRYKGLGYVLGGTPAGFSGALASIITYSETLDTFGTKSGVLGTARYGSAGNVLNGTGYIPGGFDTSNARAIVDKYNFTLDACTSAPSMSFGRYAPGTYVLNGRLYCAMGGSSGSTGSGIGQVERFDDVLNTWTTITNTGVGLVGPAAFTMNGFGYFAQGNSSGGITSATYKYDPALDTYVSSGSSYSTGGSRGARVGDKGYVWGGYSGSVTCLTTANSFNDLTQTYSSITSLNSALEFSSAGEFTPGPTLNYELQIGLPSYLAALGGFQWITKANLASAASAAAAVNIDGKTILAGGTPGNSQIYDPQQNVWTSYALVSGLSTNGTGGFGLGGRAYAIAGTVSTSVFSIDTIVKAWISSASTSNNRERIHQHNGQSLNGFGYVFGGDNGSGTYVIQTERYNQATNSWSNQGTLNTIQDTLYTGSFALNGYILSVGGYGTGRNNGVERYDDVVATWTTKSGYPLTVAGVAGLTQNGFGYGIGGFNASNTDQNAVYRYNETSDSWSSSLNYPTTVETAATDFSGIVAGGYGGSTLSSVYQFTSAIKNIVIGAGLRVS